MKAGKTSDKTTAIAAFHRAAIAAVLEFLDARSIRTLQQLNAVKGRGLLDVSLWKLLETEGKYGGRFISKGVRALEIELGRSPSRSRGVWSERVLQARFGPPPPGDTLSDLPEYCCQLDHVNERAEIINALLREPERAQEVLDASLLGCVVLRPEHARLGRAKIDFVDPWRRYREAREGPIPVWDRARGTWISLDPRA